MKGKFNESMVTASHGSSSAIVPVGCQTSIGKGSTTSRGAADVAERDVALRVVCTYAGSSVQLAADAVVKNSSYAVFVWARVEP